MVDWHGVKDPDEVELLRTAARLATDYVATIDDRPVRPEPGAVEALGELDEPLPEHGADPAETLALLDRLGSPASIASTGSNYYGFVIGATYPVALAASWLTSSWDQNNGLRIASPGTAAIHDVTRTWLVDLLGLPSETGSASSPVRRWRTRRASPWPATPCSPMPVGMSSRRACSALQN